MRTTKKYRIIFETYDVDKPSEAISRAEIVNEELNKPSNCLDFSMGLDNQIALIQGVQDKVLQEKIELLHSTKPICADCNINLYKTGTHKSTFHDVFTDHKVIMQRFKCHSCGYETRSTVRTLFNGVVSGDLKKIQATLGATHSFRESEKLFELFSGTDRQINNHDRIKHITESVGNTLEQINADEKEMLITQNAEELILNVDGSHIKTTEDQRSMEAMVSVIYRPESIKSNSKDTKNYITSKNCAASIKDDGQSYMISATIIAALKQGLSPKTHVTALCDGATNCWNIAKAIEPLCASITYILDWFHLAMKFENISLPKKLKEDLMHIKWHLWRGDIEKTTLRFKEIMELTKEEQHHDRIKKLFQYVENNKDKIVDYSSRKEAGLVFTSNLAESTVESLINQRCKGQQHMRWSRDGLNPILQLRAAIHSNDWSNKWKTAVLNAA
jgi:hypothetical protein